MCTNRCHSLSTHRAIVTVRSNSTENETVVHFMLFQWKLYATLVKSFEKWIWFLRCLHRWFLIGLLSVWKSWKCSTTLDKWFRKFLLWSYEKYKTFDKTNINWTMNNWARRTFKLKRELTFKEKKKFDKNMLMKGIQTKFDANHWKLSISTRECV